MALLRGLAVGLSLRSRMDWALQAGSDGLMMEPSHVGETYDHPLPGRISLMTLIEKLRSLAHELAGEAWDFERRQLAAQADVRRRAARVLMTQADSIQREDAMFEDPRAGFD